MIAKIAKTGFGLALLLAGSLSAQQKPAEMPVMDAGAGPCWVDFTVTKKGKPVYDAKIHSLVRYGVFHKVDVEVGTNYEGKARISGLPEKVRKPPLTFDIRQGSSVSSVTHDPATNCHASYDVEMPDVTIPSRK